MTSPQADKIRNFNMRKFYLLFFIYICNLSSTAEIKGNKDLFVIYESKENIYADLKPNQNYLSLQLDLNNDSIDENINFTTSPINYAGNEEVFGVKIKVSNKQNKLIWKSPYWISIGPAGIDEPKLIGDIDQNGKIDLIILQGRSDVGLSFYNIYEWDNNRFNLKRKNINLFFNEKNITFEWKDKLKDTSSYNKSEIYNKPRFATNFKPLENNKESNPHSLQFAKTYKFKLESYCIKNGLQKEHIVIIEKNKFKVLKTTDIN